nr:hypothetical protein [Lachnospiraceae bacterium]
MIIRNKTFCLVLLICSMMVIVTGCGNQIPEMTEAENALVTEYAAGILLQYHADYNGRLVDTSVPPVIEPIVQEPVVEETISDNSTEEIQEPDSETVSDNSASSGDGVTEVPQLSVAQVLGADGLDITCAGYEVSDSYPETEMSEDNMLFAMRAGAGNKLLVVKLNISNPTGTDIALNTISMTDLKCKLLINGSKKQNAYVSMLDQDLMMIDHVFVSGDNMLAVVVTEMPEEDASQIASVALTVQRGDNSATVNAMQ